MQPSIGFTFVKCLHSIFSYTSAGQFLLNHIFFSQSAGGQLTILGQNSYISFPHFRNSVVVQIPFSNIFFLLIHASFAVSHSHTNKKNIIQLPATGKRRWHIIQLHRVYQQPAANKRDRNRDPVLVEIRMLMI